MTPEKENINVFRANLIAETEEHGVQFKLYENRILHVVIPRFHKIKWNIIEAAYTFLDAHGGGRFYNIYEFNSFADVEPEIREWAADTSGNRYTHTDAIVIGSLSQKIISDFYLRFNRPSKPTRIFYSLDKAAEWTLGQLEEMTE